MRTRSAVLPDQHRPSIKNIPISRPPEAFDDCIRKHMSIPNVLYIELIGNFLVNRIDQTQLTLAKRVLHDKIPLRVTRFQYAYLATLVP